VGAGGSSAFLAGDARMCGQGGGPGEGKGGGDTKVGDDVRIVCGARGRGRGSSHLESRLRLSSSSYVMTE